MRTASSQQCTQCLIVLLLLCALVKASTAAPHPASKHVPTAASSKGYDDSLDVEDRYYVSARCAFTSPDISIAASLAS
jgi:hypothetical protein